MLRKFASIAGAIAVATVLSAQSAAAAVITFDDDAQNQPGVLNSAGGAGSTIVGSGIAFVSIAATGANGAATLTCTGCVLNFTTGGFTGGVSYGGGGSFSVVGAVGALGLPAGTVLVSGSFSSAALVSGGTGSTFSGFGTDTKHQAILTYFGLPGGIFDFASTDITLGTILTAGSAFANADITNADLDNSDRPVIPEPASLILLGSGLLGVGRAVRRRRMNKA